MQQQNTMADSLQPKFPLQTKRSRANLQVTGMQYKDALYELLVDDPPVLGTRSKLGPGLCSHVRQMLPGHLMAMQKVWMPFINMGCKKMVLQSKQIRCSLHSLVGELNLFIYPDTKSLLVLVIIDEGSQHIMQCATTMRALTN